MNSDSTQPPAKRARRSDTAFDFHDHCLFCGSICLVKQSNWPFALLPCMPCMLYLSGNSPLQSFSSSSKQKRTPQLNTGNWLTQTISGKFNAKVFKGMPRRGIRPPSALWTWYPKIETRGYFESQINATKNILLQRSKKPSNAKRIQLKPTDSIVSIM